MAHNFSGLPYCVFCKKFVQKETEHLFFDSFFHREMKACIDCEAKKMVSQSLLKWIEEQSMILNKFGDSVKETLSDLDEQLEIHRYANHRKNRGCQECLQIETEKKIMEHMKKDNELKLEKLWKNIHAIKERFELSL